VSQAAWVSAEFQSSQRTALADEAFAAGQRLVTSSAGAALSQMSVRFGTGNSAIARLIREQQDTTQKRRQIERVLNDERAKIPAERNPEQEKKLRADITEIDSKLTALASRLAKEAPQFSDLASPRPLAFAETQKLLGADEALVFFMFDQTTQQANSFVWALTRDGYAWGRFPIKGEEWSERVTKFRAGLDVAMIASNAALAELGKKRVLFDVAYAHQLYRELFGPVEELIRGKRQLLVVPSGPLTALPFHLLVTEKPAVTPSFENLAAYRDAEWLLKRHAVTVLPSVGSLKLLRSATGGGRASKAMVGFGDPVFASVETAATRKAARKKQVAVARSYTEYWKGAEIDRSKLALAQLPDTADELRAIAKRLGVPDGDIHLGRAASETTVKRLALADYRIVYFATHGLVAGDIKGVGEPSLALTLPAQATEIDDGLLTASEVAQLKLNADWVVLSACNTIAGDKPGAEALSGLSRAFFYAGARALLVSHWAVDSAAATRLATATFDKLAGDAKLGRAEALTLAMQDYLKDGSAAHYAYPAMWGAFSVVGDGKQ
jgi:CHAT domain-containing protein